MRGIARTVLGIAAVISGLSASAVAESLQGRWDATLTLSESVIPFRLDLSAEGANFTGTLYNGDVKVTTTSAKAENGKVVLNFEHYLTKIVATSKDGQLDGKVEGRFERDRYISSYPFRARRHVDTPVAAVNAPSIDGLWEIPYESTKGEKSWRLIVKQNGPEVSAAVLRVDGDTGALTGTYKDGKFVVSHFDGARALQAVLTPTKDGTLEVEVSGAYATKTKLIAYRPADARAKGLPEPANFDAHTKVRDPNEPFSFSFPDVNGKLVSSADPKFNGKVVVAIVTGTWCPNCHDEAQYLVQLYRKYRDQGLEIVALDFEEPEQQEDLTRVRSFVKKYGVEYTYVIAGAPVDMWEKVPQAVNLNSWPTTFFVGRDGRVKSVHAGFAAPASGEFYSQLKDEFTGTIERLLAEGNPKLNALNQSPADAAQR